MEVIAYEVRYACRVLIRNPTFTAVAVITLGLGVGANTAIFSLVNGVLLRKLPYDDPDRLVLLYHGAIDGSYSRTPTTVANFYDWSRVTRSFASMAGFVSTTANLTGLDLPQRLRGAASIGSIFDVLGVQPIRGRTFDTSEGAPEADPVVVLSYGAWRSLFGLDEQVVGRTVELDGVVRTVIGVMPTSFRFPTASTDFWTPARFDAQARQDRINFFVQVIARLGSGQTVRRASAEMERIMAGLREAHPEPNDGVRVEVVPLREQLVAGIRTRIWILMGAAGFVLLIACTNLANLSLARATGRQSEIAVRQALGATRARLVRQLLTESVVLSTLGGLVGVLVGYSFLQVLPVLDTGIPHTNEIDIDAAVLGFTLLVSVVAGLAFGGLPALYFSRPQSMERLRERARGTLARGWIRQALVASEVALAFILLVGSGLLIRSVSLLQRVDPGVRTDNVLTFRVSLPEASYPTADAVLSFFQRAVEQINGLPSVVSSATISSPPISSSWGNGAWFNMLSTPVPEGETPPSVQYRIVSPRYFETMRHPLVRGRLIANRDRLEGSHGVVISETLARTYWPQQDPIGQEIVLGPLDPAVFPTMTVVGIVKDVPTWGLSSSPSPVVYFPHALMPEWRTVHFLVHTAVEPMGVARSIRNEMATIDPALPASHIATMEQLVEQTVATERSSMILLSLFAGVALAMAAVGVFGVLSYTVTQRTRDLGIRIALGATANRVKLLVVRQGLTHAMIGVLVGLVGAAAVTRVLESLLFEVSATDPFTLVAVSLILTGVAGVASYLPARRATKVDPLTVLNAE